MDAVNHQVRLAARPVGLPEPSDWSFTEEPVAEPGDGEVLVKVRYLSLDPAMRGWMNEGRSYIPPVGIGEVMRAFAAGEVIASNDPDHAPGEHVAGLLGVQEYAVANAKAVFKIDTEIAPLPVYLGALGMPGVTAYFGLLDVGRPEAGNDGRRLRRRRSGRRPGRPDRQAEGMPRGRDRGWHGQVSLRVRGARLRRRDRLQGRGHRRRPRRALPAWDRRVLRQRRRRRSSTPPSRTSPAFARVVICGAISQYNATGAMKGPSNYMSLLVNHASMTGFVMSDYLDRYNEAVKQLAAWLTAGELVALEDIAVGLENFPDTLLRLFKGQNTGQARARRSARPDEVGGRRPPREPSA